MKSFPVFLLLSSKVTPRCQRREKLEVKAGRREQIIVTGGMLWQIHKTETGGLLLIKGRRQPEADLSPVPG